MAPFVPARAPGTPPLRAGHVGAAGRLHADADRDRPAVTPPFGVDRTMSARVARSVDLAVARVAGAERRRRACSQLTPDEGARLVDAPVHREAADDAKAPAAVLRPAAGPRSRACVHDFHPATISVQHDSQRDRRLAVSNGVRHEFGDDAPRVSNEAFIRTVEPAPDGHTSGAHSRKVLGQLHRPLPRRTSHEAAFWVRAHVPPYPRLTVRDAPAVMSQTGRRRELKL
jgi:hypothetical protein